MKLLKDDGLFTIIKCDCGNVWEYLQDNTRCHGERWGCGRGLSPEIEEERRVNHQRRTYNQPMPHTYPNSRPIEDRYITDWHATRKHQYNQGLRTYNTPLMTHNGRDAGQDALDELVDAGRYITQLRMEKEALEARVKELEGER